MYMYEVLTLEPVYYMDSGVYCSKLQDRYLEEQSRVRHR